MPAAVFYTGNDDVVVSENGFVHTIRGGAAGRDDGLITAAIDEGDAIHLFARQDLHQPFAYHGVADRALILAERNGPTGVLVPVQDRCLFRFESGSQAIQIPFAGDHGPGRGKRAALAHVNAPRDLSHVKTFYSW